jgi:nucleoside-diphosphate-sugar epimerase
MSQRALVIGGTGPTGPFIVKGLCARGFAVAMLHSGRHERDEIPADVEHIHTDPFDERALESVLASRAFEVCVATYGRLRATAKVMVGRCAKFISIGGGPAYLGYMNAETWRPAGLMPTREDAPLVATEADDAKGFRIARTEERVLALHPNATHFRYPYVYGPYQLVPREWCIVRRIHDRRPFIVLPDGGLTLCSYGYTENLAHAVLLAVDQPQKSAGQIYNCADEETLTLRQVVEIVREALGASSLEILSLPGELAVPARPLLMQPWTTHRVFDLAKLRGELGYRDVVPAREALARTARWLDAHPLARGGAEEKILQDPFDYAAEDALAAGWRRALESLARQPVAWPRAPGYTASYSGPGGTPRSGEFE